jgi:hypothetical protein
MTYRKSGGMYSLSKQQQEALHQLSHTPVPLTSFLQEIYEFCFQPRFLLIKNIPPSQNDSLCFLISTLFGTPMTYQPFGPTTPFIHSIQKTNPLFPITLSVFKPKWRSIVIVLDL